MNYGSVCSGIEAASVAWQGLGWQPAWFAEIQPFPSAVLKHHHPSVPNLGDMTKIALSIENGLVGAPDVLVGGTPCQAFSLAGSRNSLSDARGNLTLKYVELANVIDRIRLANNQSPAVIVWENVPGVLSTQDNAFGCFLGALCGETQELQPSGERWTDAGIVRGPKRSVAWRVLDAQFCGLAQRRRRVFVIASAGTIDPAQVLFEWQGVRRDVAPCSDERQDIAALGDWDAGGSGHKVDSVAPYFVAGNIIGRQPQHGGKSLGISAVSVSRCLTTKDRHAVILEDGARYLTPLEWERLQGFPDNYTLIPYNKGWASDYARYTALGNSMAVPVVRWIGERIAQVSRDLLHCA